MNEKYKKESLIIMVGFLGVFLFLIYIVLILFNINITIYPSNKIIIADNSTSIVLLGFSSTLSGNNQVKIEYEYPLNIGINNNEIIRLEDSKSFTVKSLLLINTSESLKSGECRIYPITVNVKDSLGINHQKEIRVYYFYNEIDILSNTNKCKIEE